MTQTTAHPTMTSNRPWGAPFAVFGADRAVVLSKAQIRQETIAEAQHRALNAEAGQILGILVPFERNALATTFLGRPSKQPNTDAVRQPGSLDFTTWSLTSDSTSKRPPATCSL